MSNVAMCRICLTSNVRLHDILGTPLQEILEKLISSTLSLEDCKPQYACYICHWHLKRCHNLMATALRADQLLKQVLENGVQITRESISTTDIQLNKLTNCLTTSPLESLSIDDYAVGSTENDKVQDGAVKTEDPVKVETCNESDTHFSEPDHQSDSEDDLPLKSISVKEKERKNRVKVRKKTSVKKKEDRSLIKDFAREIILTKGEQLKELEERSKSFNYINAPLKCSMCFKGFVDTRAYDNHMEKHDKSSGPHACDICHMRYQTSRQLRTHAATSHTRRYACNKCAHTSHTANQARDHEKWHSGYTYECKLCGQKFSKPTSYLTHMRKRHPTQHVCHICGDSFVGRHGLLMHKSKAHRDQKPAENAEEPASKRFCSECNIEFATVDAWKRHVLSSYTYYTHALSSDSSFQCKICQISFSSSTTLGMHLKEHERALKATRSAPVVGKPSAELVCDQCGAHFVNRSKLQAHIKRTHLGLKYNKNIVCEVCGKKCTSNASLKYHQRTHTGERPYQCTTCSKRFVDNNQLRIHIRSHTGERPYCCAQCGKRFSQKPALNRHYRVHTGAKPYTCQFCSKTFSQSNSMKLHVKTVHLKTPVRRRNDEKTDTVTLQAL